MAWISPDIDRTLLPRNGCRYVVREVLIARHAALAIADLLVPPQAGA
jgi:hypothetical protein